MLMAIRYIHPDRMFIIIRVEQLSVFLLFPSIFEVEDSHICGRGLDVGR